MLVCGDLCLPSVCCGNVSLVGAPARHGGAQIGNGMADLLAAHFSSGLVAAKLGGAERPMCGNPGTGALWRDLGFVAQRYVVKVSRPGSDHLWYFFFCRSAGAQLDLVLLLLFFVNLYLLLCDY